MYKVLVQGEYIARSPHAEGERICKRYEVEVKLPTMNAALSKVKNHVLGPALSKRYPDYITFRTYNIMQVTPLSEAAKERMDRANVNYMDREQLTRLIQMNNVGACELKEKNADGQTVTKQYGRMQPKYYPDLIKLREAVGYALEDPQGYTKNFLLHKQELEEALAMAQANPELFEGQSLPDHDFVGTISGGAFEKPAKALDKSRHIEQTESRVRGLQADQERDGEIGPMDTPSGTDQAPDLDDL